MPTGVDKVHAAAAEFRNLIVLIYVFCHSEINLGSKFDHKTSHILKVTFMEVLSICLIELEPNSLSKEQSKYNIEE